MAKSLYKVNHTWRRNPAKLARYMELLRAKLEKEKS